MAAIRLSDQSSHSIEMINPATVMALATPAHRPGERLADDGGIGGEARGQLGRRLALHPRQVCPRQVLEHPHLQLAYHAQHQALREHSLPVGGGGP